MNRRFAELQRPILTLILIGATVGVLLDGVHSHFGATSYTNPVFAKTAWWAPLLFAGAYVGGIARPLLSDKPLLPSWKPAVGMGLFVAAYFVTVAPLDVSTRVALLIGMFVTGYHFCDPSRACLIVSAIAAFSGPFVEINLIQAGLFVHHEAHFAGVPYWLPVLYMNAGVGLGTLALWLVQTSQLPDASASAHAQKKSE
ncbi:MAG TPA: hypothetical protein PK156_26205 [Polyangium sp.]|nr:hypothetical protein [Polyangium sp.]